MFNNVNSNSFKNSNTEHEHKEGFASNIIAEHNFERTLVTFTNLKSPMICKIFNQIFDKLQ